MTTPNTSIMTVSEFKTPTRTFKDERLTKATQEIANIYANAVKYVEDKNAEIAKVLALVASQKSYEKDGFKSVADYAQTVFGIARQKSYALAAAGKVYNDTTANPVLRSMPYSKLAAISAVDNKAVNQAIKDGVITATSTQADLKAFAKKESEKKAAEQPVKVEILKTYTASPKCVMTGDVDRLKDTLMSPKTIEQWDAFFIDFVLLRSPGSIVEIINLPKGKITPDGKAVVIRHLYVNMTFSLVVEFFSYVPRTEKKDKPKIDIDLSKLSLEELQAELAARMKAANDNASKSDEIPAKSSEIKKHDKLNEKPAK